jgi:hypothetical protein
MTLYVALVALANLAFGYALALFLHSGAPPFAFATAEPFEAEDEEVDEDFEDYET